MDIELTQAFAWESEDEESSYGDSKPKPQREGETAEGPHAGSYVVSSLSQWKVVGDDAGMHQMIGQDADYRIGFFVWMEKSVV